MAKNIQRTCIAIFATESRGEEEDKALVSVVSYRTSWKKNTHTHTPEKKKKKSIKKALNKISSHFK